MPNAGTHKIYSIQYLRAIAAFSIIIFHQAARQGNWFRIGSSGVDVFFISSGFIIWIITEHKPTTALIFFLNRLSRIAPLYWIITLITVLGCLLYPDLFWDCDKSGKQLLASLLFIPRINNTGHNWPTLFLGWTLNIEIFFYFLVAITMRFQRHVQLIALSFILLGLVCVGWLFHPSSAVLATYTNSVILEFAAGLWIGHCWIKGKMPKPEKGIFLICLGFFIFIVEERYLNSKITSLRGILWGIPSLFIVLGALSIERDKRLIYVAPLILLGDASYSIYLLQELATLPVKLMPFQNAVSVVSAICLTGLIGVGSFFYVERPLQRRGRQLILDKMGS